MALPPAWKIKRELLAANDQIKAFFLYFAGPFRRYFYNRRELTSLQTHDGGRNLQGRLVLYLVFQPQGLLESNFIAINYLISQGHEVLLVSNGALSDGDIKKLQPLCWRILVRDNIGYDFGGYRCGVNYLKYNQICLETFTFINDSIWFPVIADSNILNQTEDIVTDFGGAVFMNDLKSTSGGLVLSYWVTIRKPLWEAECFWDYWGKYIPTGNKTLTVKLGERGLSRQMHQAGRDVDGVFTTEKFLVAVQAATKKQLELTLKYGSFTDPLFQEECMQLLDKIDSSDLWRNNCLKFIERVVQKRNFLHSFCYASIAILRVPFLKKNNLRLHFLMRQQYLRAVYSGDLPSPNPSILQEIEKGTDPSNYSAAFR
jgi:hypothetical protein